MEKKKQQKKKNQDSDISGFLSENKKSKHIDDSTGGIFEISSVGRTVWLLTRKHLTHNNSKTEVVKFTYLKTIHSYNEMNEEFRVVTPDFVSLIITTSRDEYNCTVERRFAKSITIAELKGKMELQTGGNAATMSLELYDKEDTLVSKLSNDEAPLGSYCVENGMRLHVIDKFTLKSEFEDLSKVERFHLPKEEYDKRTDSVKSFLQKNKLGKYNEAEVAAREEARRKEIEHEIELAKKCKIDDRCEVRVPGQPTRRGTVKYVGEVEQKIGWWIGVQYDEPLGKHNGTINGKTYFECPPNYGAFVRPIYVTVGDFPEEHDLDEEL